MMEPDQEQIDVSGAEQRPSESVVSLLRACLAEASCDPATWKAASPWGLPELRERLGTSLGEAPERIAITSGVRSAAVCLLSELRSVVVECPSFPGIPQLLVSLGAKVRRAAWAELSKHDESAVWLTHPARNPDGISLGSRDCELLSRRKALTVINEVYRWHCTEHIAVPPDDHIVWTGSLAKVFGHRARLGWVRGPGAAHIDKHRMRACAPDPAIQGMWARFIGRDGLELLGVRTREAAETRASFVAMISEQLLVADGRDGSSVVVVLPDGWTVKDAAARLLAKGVVVGDAEAFGWPVPAVRCVFDGVPSALAEVVAARVLSVLG